MGVAASIRRADVSWNRYSKRPRAITLTRLPMRSTGGCTKGCLATVYRNLHSLVEEGKIRTLLLDGQGARYDPETIEHDHFVCERCGRVDDLFLQRARRRIDLISLAKRGYVVATHNLMVHGDVSGLCRSTSAFPARRPVASKS